MTQFDLAEAAGMSRSYLADLERGQFNPTLDKIRAMASALHVSISELLGEADTL